MPRGQQAIRGHKPRTAIYLKRILPPPAGASQYLLVDGTEFCRGLYAGVTTDSIGTSSENDDDVLRRRTE